jgi:hypothetical protein
MTSFVHTSYPTTHSGVERFESAAATIKTAAKGLTGSRGLATLLLAAMVSALLVVANEVIDSVSDGHLFAAWIALWTIAFAALALFASPARQLSVNLSASWAAWTVARKAAAADEHLWSIALQDARVMADINAAISRSQPVTTLAASAAPVVKTQVAHLSTRANYVSIAADSAHIEAANKASQVRIKRMLAAANGH